MKLSIIIVNYNVRYFLEQALLSVGKSCSGIDSEVFVVDNNSVDDSVEMVKEKFPEVKLYANKKNTGFAVANNQAIREASGEYILLLNPDTVVEEDTFEKCIAFMDAHPEAGGLGVKMIDGSGKFLPESKRGFPSPFVAFSKSFGLSKIFPKSRLFNRYHLGFLDENETHEVEVLAGAFMFLRKTALDKVGWLDEAFFMYGEDIDLSYRIVQGGYKNYYFPETTIIHYKGESTKKGSLNYVRTFYKAMIIFAKKHFKGEKARLFVLMLNLVIWMRALLTLVRNFVKKIYLPLLDGALILLGLVILKDFWANYHFHDPDYYDHSFLLFNAPLYIIIWLAGIYFSGAYDDKSGIRRLIRGLLLGTLFLAAIYGFLELEHRTSRALILLGAAWALFSTVILRLVLHFLRYRNFNMSREQVKNLVIVGSRDESVRVEQLLHQAGVRKNMIGTIAPEQNYDYKQYLNSLHRLDEVVQIYKVEEIIFCSKDVPSGQIMHWMTRLGPALEYKIVPSESLSIIGSSSKNTAGELYTIDIQFAIANRLNQRNKRFFDLALAALLLITFPLHIFFMRQFFSFLKNIFQVLAGKKSWVAYAYRDRPPTNLPPIRPGVLTPLHALKIKNLDAPTIKHLNFLYAKDYQLWKDLDILWKGYRRLGDKEIS